MRDQIMPRLSPPDCPADNVLYTLHEKDNTLTAQPIPADPNGASTITASSNIVPPNPPAGAKFAAAEIVIPPTSSAFPDPLIFVSNRNIGETLDPKGDTIAIYRPTAGGGLEQVGQVFTGLDQVRSMEFSPVVNGEQFLVAGGSAGTGGVAVFKRVEGGEGLTLVARNTEVATRTSFVWV